MSKERVDFDFRSNGDRPCEHSVKARSNESNPLELSPVIKSILGYLNLRDVKNCRFLNTEWSSEGLLALKSRSKIVFCKSYNPERTPSQFFELFPDSEETASFTAFKIRGSKLPETWTVCEWDNFFERQQKSIRELEITRLNLVDYTGSILEIFDITHWLTNSPMTVPNTKYNTKLYIGCDDTEYWKLSVQISALVHIKQIKLEFCKLNLQDRMQLSPVELKLDVVCFERDGIKLKDTFCVNNIINFSKMKKLNLSRGDSFLFGRSSGTFDLTLGLSLDTAGHSQLHLQYLKLQNIKIKNRKNCRWTVETAIFEDISFTQKTGMGIKELRANYDEKVVSFDFSVLPPTLERLDVFMLPNSSYECSTGSVYLPNLKSLRLYGDFSSVFPHFANCPLVDLTLEGYCDSFIEFRFSLIPRTVKRLELLYAKMIINENDEPLILEKFIVNLHGFQRQLEERYGLLSGHFKTETLIFVVFLIHNPAKELEGFSEFFIRNKSCIDSRQRYYIGGFAWSTQGIHGEFLKRSLSPFVDKESRCYLFENQKGKAFPMAEFMRIKDFHPEDRIKNKDNAFVY